MTFGPNLQKLMEEHPEEEFLVVGNGLQYDSAIIGCELLPEGGVPGKMYRVKYSVTTMLEILASGFDRDDDEDEDFDPFTEAREFFDFNIGGAYVGPQTPYYHEDAEESEDEDIQSNHEGTDRGQPGTELPSQ